MDVALHNTADGGEITISSGDVLVDDGLATAVYLSLWGGNDDDNGTEATKHLQWWGNLDEPVAARRYRSETQALLESSPITTAKLRALQEAAGRDLAWMKEDLADEIEVTTTIPAVDKVQLTVKVFVGENEFTFPFIVERRQAAS